VHDIDVICVDEHGEVSMPSAPRAWAR
jgi:hypothetical protein